MNMLPMAKGFCRCDYVKDFEMGKLDGPFQVLKMGTGHKPGNAGFLLKPRKARK